MKTLKIVILCVFLLCQTLKVYADDNATSGSGETGHAVKGRGFYLGSEYMYKVTVYVGLSDKADTSSSLNNYKMVGNTPVFLKPNTFQLPMNLKYGMYSKVNYLNGSALTPMNNVTIVTDNPPPPPITNNGNINNVKSYFGDTGTLNMLINAFARQKGTTREALVSNIQFTINGVQGKYSANDILPVKVGGTYTNKVPWVVIYEPVIISYLKDGVTRLAFTATEYALAQKLGYFNFKFGDNGQYISGMTHSDLPNSIILEESWFGFPVTPALPDNVYWSEDRIIKGGGWGMRMLRANGLYTGETGTYFDYEYRVDTDVITSVNVHTRSRITSDNKAYVTINANGYSITKEVVIPSDDSQLIWLKWHTPRLPQIVNITASISGNTSAYLDSGARLLTARANVVSLNEKVPPNPTFYDQKPYGFAISSVPSISQQASAFWSVWSCWWKSNMVWQSDWQWKAEWKWKSDWEYDEKTGQWTDFGGWVDYGKWVDCGKYMDKGDWQYDRKDYHAFLSADMIVKPDNSTPTALNKSMKSGYGVNLSVSTSLTSNSTASDITGAQNVISYYPEFNYTNYCRVSDMIRGGYNALFELKRNSNSIYNNRVHFIPLWYPDGRYIPVARVIDVWTPVGMLSCVLEDYVNIKGSMYDDYHIGPK